MPLPHERNVADVYGLSIQSVVTICRFGKSETKTSMLSITKKLYISRCLYSDYNVKYN